MRALSDYMTVHLLFDQLAVPDEEQRRGLRGPGQTRYRHLVNGGYSLD